MSGFLSNLTKKHNEDEVISVRDGKEQKHNSLKEALKKGVLISATVATIGMSHVGLAQSYDISPVSQNTTQAVQTIQAPAEVISIQDSNGIILNANIGSIDQVDQQPYSSFSIQSEDAIGAGIEMYQELNNNPELSGQIESVIQMVLKDSELVNSFTEKAMSSDRVIHTDMFGDRNESFDAEKHGITDSALQTIKSSYSEYVHAVIEAMAKKEVLLANTSGNLPQETLKAATFEIMQDMSNSDIAHEFNSFDYLNKIDASQTSFNKGGEVISPLSMANSIKNELKNNHNLADSLMSSETYALMHINAGSSSAADLNENSAFKNPSAVNKVYNFTSAKMHLEFQESMSTISSPDRDKIISYESFREDAIYTQESMSDEALLDGTWSDSKFSSDPYQSKYNLYNG